MIRGVIFDCDGVLFDGLRANVAYYSAVLEHFGLPPIADTDDEKIHLCHTATTRELFAAILGPGRVEEAIAAANRIGYRKFIPLMDPMPNIKTVVEKLSARMPLAIATNRSNSMQGVATFFGMDHYFRTIVTCRDVARGKPHPDMLLLAAERLNIAPQDLLFVGDTCVDREAARRAGIRFVGYRGDFENAVNITDHTQLLNLVEQL